MYSEFKITGLEAGGGGVLPAKETEIVWSVSQEADKKSVLEISTEENVSSRRG